MACGRVPLALEGSSRVMKKPTVIEETVVSVGTVPVTSDDLARIVDADCTAAMDPEGIVDVAVSAAAEEEAVLTAAAVLVRSDDLTCIVDPECPRVTCAGQRIVEGGVSAAAQEKAVEAGGVEVFPGDLPP